jgi:hypothetical protein
MLPMLPLLIRSPRAVFYFLYSYAAIDSVIAGALPHQLQQNLQHWQQQHSKPGLLPIEPIGLSQQQQQQHWSRQVLADGHAFHRIPSDHSPAAAAPVHAVYHGLRLHISDSPPGHDQAQHSTTETSSRQPCFVQHGSDGSSSSSSLLGYASRSSRSYSKLTTTGLASGAGQHTSGCPPAAAAPGNSVGTLRHLQQVQQTHLAALQGVGSATVHSYSASEATQNSSTSSSNHSAAGSSSSRRRSVSSRHGDPALSHAQRLLRGAFYVWVNVMNLVCISSLWARCADAFTPEVRGLLAVHVVLASHTRSTRFVYAMSSCLSQVWMQCKAVAFHS